MGEDSRASAFTSGEMLRFVAAAEALAVLELSADTKPSKLGLYVRCEYLRDVNA